MKRRAVLTGLAGILAAGVSPLILSRPSAADLTGKNKRVVIAGGGVAGCKTAVELRRLLPDAEILLVEPQPSFFSGPATLDCVFGRRPFADAMRGYELLSAKGIKIIRGQVLGADMKKNMVETSKGSFVYSALVAASGIELATETIDGLQADPEANLSLYDRQALSKLHTRLFAFKGGNIVVSAPPGAVKCSPAPYEYVLLLAHHLKSRNLKGKVVLIDDRPNPQPQLVADGFSAAFGAFGPYIDYVFQESVARVDVKKREVETSMGDKIPYDLLSLIPPNKASKLVAKLGIQGSNDSFADVDPLTLRSKVNEAVFALGDAARTPYGFSAAAAFESAVLCAKGVAGQLGVKQPDITQDSPARVQTACYPYLSPDLAMRSISRYAVHLDKGALKLHSDPDAEAKGTPDNKAARLKWERDMLASIFG
ncbi:MAG: NAD(P)/FAD-dependent oxidoreductase [Alphaproteobacteria bacterium]|nr:NAD(P)/FAD-dependent oxidoreductase [Alphaproteobacteria bacterium]